MAIKPAENEKKQQYTLVASGTTLAELDAAVAALTIEEYYDSFVTIKDSWLDTSGIYMRIPIKSSTKTYQCVQLYNGGSPLNVLRTYYYSPGQVQDSVYYVNGTISAQQTSDGTLTISGWKLYVRK